GVIGGVIGGTTPGTPVVLPRRALQDGAPAIPVPRAPGVLKEIEIVGFSKPATEALMSRLEPFKGQPMSNDAATQMQRIVAETDQHLAILFRNDANGDVTVRVSVRQQGSFMAGTAAQAPPAATGSDSGAPQRIRGGGAVQANNLVSKRQPTYPPLAKQARIQGVVRLEAIISKEGRIEQLTVQSGHPLLVPAALEAVQEWVYRPTLLN